MCGCVGDWRSEKSQKQKSGTCSKHSVCAFVGEISFLRLICMFIVLPLLNRDFFVVVVQLCCYVLHSVSVLLAHSHFFFSLSLPPSICSLPYLCPSYLVFLSGSPCCGMIFTLVHFFQSAGTLNFVFNGIVSDFSLPLSLSLVYFLHCVVTVIQSHLHE